MKYRLTLVLILIAYMGFGQNPPVEILQINAKWNQHNNVLLDKMPKNYRGYIIKVKYALLEEQGPGFKKSFAGHLIFGPLFHSLKNIFMKILSSKSLL